MRAIGILFFVGPFLAVMSVVDSLRNPETLLGNMIAFALALIITLGCFVWGAKHVKAETIESGKTFWRYMLLGFTLAGFIMGAVFAILFT